MPSEELEQLKAARPRKEFGDSHIGYSIDLDAWADSIIAYAEKVTAENYQMRRVIDLLRAQRPELEDGHETPESPDEDHPYPTCFECEVEWPCNRRVLFDALDALDVLAASPPALPAEEPALRVSLRGEPFAEGSLRNRFNRAVGQWFMDRTNQTVLYDWSDDLYEVVAPFFNEQLGAAPTEGESARLVTTPPAPWLPSTEEET